MNLLLTAAGMRAVERSAIDSGAVTGANLMQRAGQGVVDAVLTRWPALAAKPGRAVIYCGPGNNGGDGYIVARLLKLRGWQVALFSTCDPARLTGDAHAAWLGWTGAKGQVTQLGSNADDPFAGFRDQPPDLIVDAILGTGLTRPLDRAIEQAIADIQFYKEQKMVRLPTVAVDIPTGLCADSGRNMGNHCVYDLTVTFHTAKPGHYLDEGPFRCGALHVVDIGLPHLPAYVRPLADQLFLVGCPDFLLKDAGHKYDHGHVLVLTGGAGRTGAARLAARGAQRVGAGLVTLGVPPAAQFEVAAQITSAMLVRIRDAAAFERVLDDRRLNTLCIGPGLGRDARGAALLQVALASGRDLVLDADAITLLADHPALRAALHDRCVLTPHGGEFARLFPDLAARLRGAPGDGPACSKADVTRDAAALLGCTVLLKGPDTVIAAPDGRVALHSAAYGRAAPWLATAGAGDVLAGMIAGFLARGQRPFEAACAAAWLHVEAALAFGPGLIAEDLPEAIPTVLRAV